MSKFFLCERLGKSSHSRANPAKASFTLPILPTSLVYYIAIVITITVNIISDRRGPIVKAHKRAIVPTSNVFINNCKKV